MAQKGGIPWGLSWRDCISICSLWTNSGCKGCRRHSVVWFASISGRRASPFLTSRGIRSAPCREHAYVFATCLLSQPRLTDEQIPHRTEKIWKVCLPSRERKIAFGALEGPMGTVRQLMPSKMLSTLETRVADVASMR